MKKLIIGASLLVLILGGIGLFMISSEKEEEEEGYQPIIQNGEEVYDGTKVEEEYRDSLKEESERLQAEDEKKEKVENEQSNSNKEEVENEQSNSNKEYQLTGQYFGFGDDGNHFSIYSNGEEIQLNVDNEELMKKLDEFEFEEMITITYKIESGNKMLVNIKS